MRLALPFGIGRKKGNKGVLVIVRDVASKKQKGFTIHDAHFLEVLDEVEFGLRHRELIKYGL